MNDRYDTAGNVEAQFEPGSCGWVLANQLGIPIPEEMGEGLGQASVTRGGNERR